MDIRKLRSWLQRELDNLDILIASIEDHMARSRERVTDRISLSAKMRNLADGLKPPFEAPEIGIWLPQDR